MNITFVVDAKPISKMAKLVDSYERIKKNPYDDSVFLIYNLNILEYNDLFLTDYGMQLLCNPVIGIMLNNFSPINQYSALTLTLYFSVCYEITNQFCKFSYQFENNVPQILQSVISSENGIRASELKKTYFTLLTDMLSFVVDKEKYYNQRKKLFV